MTPPRIEKGIAEINTIIGKTEENLKRIQNINNSFVFPVLNQWRYATRHMANYLSAPENDGECQKVIAHLKKAYADSCEVLLIVHLRRAVLFLKRYSRIRGYPTLSSLLDEYMGCYIDGQSILKKKIDVITSCTEVESTINKLEGCYQKANNIRLELEYVLKSHRKRVAVNILAFLTSIAGILWSLWNLWGAR